MLSSSAFALKEYYAIGRSLRAMGMGGAFYGLSDDESALFYNPASLSLYPGNAQFMVSLGAQVADNAIQAFPEVKSAAEGGTVEEIVSRLESLQGKPIASAVNVTTYFLAKGFAFGILAAEPKVTAALLGAGIDSSLDVTAISDHGAFLAFAGSLLHPSLHFGVTAKLLARAGGQKLFSPLDILQTGSLKLEDIGGAGAGADFDLGVTYDFGLKRPNKAGASLVFRDLLATEFPWGRVNSGAPPPLERTLSLGLYYEWRPNSQTVDYLRLLVDFAEFGLGGNANPELGARRGAFGKHVNVGVEMPLWGWLFLRSGVHQGNVTGGLGLSFDALKLDVATYAEELTAGVGRLSNRRWAMRLAIGFGAPGATVGSQKPAKGRKSS